MRALLFIFLIANSLSWNCKAQDSLFIYFKKSKSLNEIIENKQPSIKNDVHYTYLFNPFKTKKEYLRFMTNATFNFDPKPFFIVNKKIKKEKVIKIAALKKMGYENAMEFLKKQQKHKFFIIDKNKSTATKYFVREVVFVVPPASE
jgi:hypothetical protein